MKNLRNNIKKIDHIVAICNDLNLDNFERFSFDLNTNTLSLKFKTVTIPQIKLFQACINTITKHVLIQNMFTSNRTGSAKKARLFIQL